MEPFEKDGKWYRICPEQSCRIKIECSNKSNAMGSFRKGRYCRQCAMKHRDISGDKNPFYGKKHSSETIEKIRRSQEENGYDVYRTEEYREKQRQATQARLDAGYKHQSVLVYWVEKYGESIAKEKWEDRRRKYSKAASGKNNPMYGKPSPQGAGNGYKGWLNGKYFRSLRELMFMIDNPDFITGESKFWTASYRWNGVDRTTRPDFVLESSKTVVECKPKRLWGSPQVTARADAVRDLAESRGYSYIMIDPDIDGERILSLIDSGEVVMDRDYEDRIRKWLEQ